MKANTRRPPIRSVSSPRGIRSSDPSTTGIEIITDVSMLERPSSSWMSGAIGASIPQAEKVTAKAIVARTSCLVDSPLPAITDGYSSTGWTGRRTIRTEHDAR